MKYIFPLIACLLLSLLSCTGRTGLSSSVGTSENTTVFSSKEWMRATVQSAFENMTLTQKSSQVLMTGIDGKERFAPYLYSHFDNVVPGAVLLFGFNVADSPAAFARYLDSCNDAFASLHASVPVLFAIDHEGGDVYRTGRLTTRLPSALDVASRFSPLEAESLFRATGAQLSLLGVQVNLAPVTEARTEANADFLGSRTFSGNPEAVATYTEAAVKGYRSSGILTVFKHFPGNGPGDPHTGLPKLDVSRKEFDADYIKPFRQLLGLEPDAVLVSHIIVLAVDPARPFCLSPQGVTGLLRDELKYDGLILTDDISMDAIARYGCDSAEAAILALRAGCDMVMTSDSDIRSIAEAVQAEAGRDAAFAHRLDDAVIHILELKYRAGLVKTAHQSYSKSRSAGISKTVFRFDQAAFNRAKAYGDRILEESRDN